MKSKISDKGLEPSTRRVPLEVINTAESMFAEHGIGVSLRQICVQAGYRNPSTIQYHFGSRGGLLQAILEQRLPVIDRRRAELIAKCIGDDCLRCLVEAMVRPLFEINRVTRYVDFWVRIAGNLELFAAFARLGHLSEAAHELNLRILAHLDELPEQVRAIRVHHAMDLTFAAIANRSRSIREGGTRGLPEDDELFLKLLCDSIVGLLRAEHVE